MARWTIPFLLLSLCAGFAQAGGKELQFQGKLAKDDPTDPQRGGPMRTHVVPLKAGKSYTIDMVGTGFDSYLRLLDNKDNQLEEDDDSGGNLNARILFNCTQDGMYKLVCTTFGPNMTGSYTLTIKTGDSLPKPSSAHTQLIGQPAPVLHGDFAVNGKPVRLSDLKGKVVLLGFWDVRSSQCAAALLRMGAWSKTYQAAGLAVVGVSFYPADIDQAVGFDAAAGQVVAVKQADHQSDRALLRAVAAHHKIEHVLLALPRQEALAAFDAYAVNSVPQLVLIDRKGIVRLIDVSGGKNGTEMENTLKKLLAEK